MVLVQDGATWRLNDEAVSRWLRQPAAEATGRAAPDRAEARGPRIQHVSQDIPVKDEGNPKLGWGAGQPHRGTPRVRRRQGGLGRREPNRGQWGVGRRGGEAIRRCMPGMPKRAVKPLVLSFRTPETESSSKQTPQRGPQSGSGSGSRRRNRGNSGNAVPPSGIAGPQPGAISSSGMCC